jgi:hypothetical protein
MRKPAHGWSDIFAIFACSLTTPLEGYVSVGLTRDFWRVFTNFCCIAILEQLRHHPPNIKAQ